MEIGRKVHALRFPFYVTSSPEITLERFVYVYLIYGSEICLVDTGVASSEEAIFDYVRKTDRKISDISLIIQTHSHPDHIGATRVIKAETRCSVAVHPSEKAWIENVELQARERPVPGFHSLVSGPVAVDRTLEDGDIVNLGCGMKLQVLHTPGHSKGSISLLLPGFNVLFSGDAVPVPGEMPVYEDLPATLKSLKRLMGVPDIRHLLASWDEPRKGKQAYERMDESLRYLQRIHDSVIRAAGDDPEPEPMELCRRVLENLGIPPVAANPLVAGSLMSHLILRGQKDILR
jgi:hydroxyacylglutathione hydrolase